jgi:heptaprenyl diphosphate synthase
MSNLSQMALAWFFLFGNSVRFIAPPFFAVGLITGITLGVFCEVFTRRSSWFASRRVR